MGIKGNFRLWWYFNSRRGIYLYETAFMASVDNSRANH